MWNSTKIVRFNVTYCCVPASSVFVATGGLVTDDWQQFAWPKIRYLEKHFRLQPWYSDTNAFLASVAAQQQDAVRARIAADAAAAQEAAAAAATAAANPALNLTTITETVVPVRATGDTETSSSNGSRAGTKQGFAAPGSSASGADLLPAATPAGTATTATAAAQLAQTVGAATGEQGGRGDATSYVHFDVQPPPAIVAAGAGGAASSKPGAATSSSTKQFSQAAKAPARVQRIDTHANLPAPVLDLDGRAGSALLLDVPAAVEEEQISVPATIEEVPA
jgi:hypothetical protein